MQECKIEEQDRTAAFGWVSMSVQRASRQTLVSHLSGRHQLVFRQSYEHAAQPGCSMAMWIAVQSPEGCISPTSNAAGSEGCVHRVDPLHESTCRLIERRHVAFNPPNLRILLFYLVLFRSAQKLVSRLSAGTTGTTARELFVPQRQVHLIQQPHSSAVACTLTILSLSCLLVCRRRLKAPSKESKTCGSACDCLLFRSTGMKKSVTGMTVCQTNVQAFHGVRPLTGGLAGGKHG